MINRNIKYERLMDLLVAAAKEEKKVVCGETSKTYNEILLTAIEMSNKIKEFGKAKNVGIFLPNGIEFIESYFAVQAADKIPVLISILESGTSISKIINDVNIDLVITNINVKKSIISALDKVDYNCSVYNVDTKKVYMNNKIRQVSVNKDDLQTQGIAVIIKTSGTLSNPKYVMLTHKGILENIEAHIRSVDFTDNENTLITLPMCFGYCFSSQLLAHIYLKCNIYIHDTDFECKYLVESILKWNITNITIVPSMLFVLTRYIKKTSIQLTSLKKLIFGGMKINEKDIRNLKDLLPNTSLVQTYGQTEHSPRITTLIYDQDFIPASVGKAISGVNIKIVSKTEGVGEICVKSNCIMKGYYGNPELTRKTVVDGWLHTGDLGYMDDDGYLFLVGRAKNIIIHNGINICPEEIEECINQVEGVVTSIVVGEKEPVVGEKPIAKVVLEKGYNQQIVRKSIIEKCKEILPSYKYPAKIEVVDDIERTYTGKVRRYGIDY